MIKSLILFISLFLVSVCGAESLVTAENYAVGQAVSDNLKEISLSLKFPRYYQFSTKQQSMGYLKNGKGDVLRKYLIKNGDEKLSVNTRLKTDKIFLNLNIFYCKENTEDLCIQKEIIYTILIDPASEKEELNINYQILPIEQP